jgi:isoamylase
MKQNAANGEGGQDGSNDNLSWNCGAEGETEDYGVKAIRNRQMKNFQVALMVSQGTPMILMGDEYGHTRLGNNNSYGHDTAINHHQWLQLESKRNSLFRFFAKSIKFRKEHPLLGRESFLGEKDVSWHEHDWSNADSRFLALTLHEGKLGGGDLYVAFNSHNFGVQVEVASPPPGKHWSRVVDTNLPSPDDFCDEGKVRIGNHYEMAPFSSVIFHAKS